MVDAASNDRLDPALQRDLFFRDLAETRRQALVSSVLALLAVACCTADLFMVGGYPSWRLLGPVGTSLLLLSILFGRPWRRQGSRLLRADVPPVQARGLAALDELLAAAAADPDLATDRRLAPEAATARRVRILAKGIGLVFLALTVAATFLVLRNGTLSFAGIFGRPAPTVELVDVTLIPWSPDFHGAITVDVTGGRVSQIAPYDHERGGRVPKFRAFEALGKYLVAGERIDFSRSGWFDRFKNSSVRPIDIGTAGDFLVFDVDPRTHDVTADQIAAAVIGGSYLSRGDMRAKPR